MNVIEREAKNAIDKIVAELKPVVWSEEEYAALISRVEALEKKLALKIQAELEKQAATVVSVGKASASRLVDGALVETKADLVQVKTVAADVAKVTDTVITDIKQDIEKL